MIRELDGSHAAVSYFATDNGPATSAAAARKAVPMSSSV
jgi:hypothetical protein